MPPFSADGPPPEVYDYKPPRKPSKAHFPIPTRPTDVSVGDWLRNVRYFRWSARPNGGVRIDAFFGEKAVSAVIPERLDGAAASGTRRGTSFCRSLKVAVAPGQETPRAARRSLAERGAACVSQTSTASGTGRAPLGPSDSSNAN